MWDTIINIKLYKIVDTLPPTLYVQLNNCRYYKNWMTGDDITYTGTNIWDFIKIEIVHN